MKTKRYWLGLPLFNAIVLLIWVGTSIYLQIAKPDAEQVTIATYSAWLLLLLMSGGFMLIDFILGLALSWRQGYAWKRLLLCNLYSALGIFAAYFLCMVPFTDAPASLLSTVLIILFEQMFSYLVGSVTGKVVSDRLYGPNTF